MSSFRTFGAVLCTVAGLSLLVGTGSLFAAEAKLSDAEISRELTKESNKIIIEEFLKQELREVNDHVTKYMVKDHPSLEFFFKQVDKGPLESLLFLEQQVHRLREAQRNINSFPFSISFSSAEKKKIMGLKSTADRIVSYGIPLMKRDFVRVAAAAKELADQRRKHPMELLRHEEFRDAIYRRIEPTAAALDTEMGKLSEGELICMSLGWTLEQVTITRLWLVFNDNSLPAKSDYMLFRKKRGEYWQKRLEQIYSQKPSDPPRASRNQEKRPNR